MKYINKLNYVDEAEKAIKSLMENDDNGNRNNKNGQNNKGNGYNRNGQNNKGSGKKQIKLTTSKIRNILMMVSDLYNEAIRNKDEKLNEDIVSRTKYMKMRLVYEIGRDKSNGKRFGVEEFARKAHLIEIIDSIGDKRENLILFCNYMEALVSYHKYYGGRD